MLSLMSACLMLSLSSLCVVDVLKKVSSNVELYGNDIE